MNTEESIRSELREALLYLKEKGNLRPGARVVIGCSTSEVAGGTIGKNSVPELGEVMEAYRARQLTSRAAASRLHVSQATFLKWCHQAHLFYRTHPQT